MSWFSRNRHWLLLALIAVTTVLVVGTVGVGLLAVLAGLAGGASVGAVLADAALVLLIAALLVAADLALAVGFLATIARRASLPSLPALPENERAASAFKRIENAVPQLSRFGLSDQFAVSTETKREQLTQQYVNDQLTQREYERRLQSLLTEERRADTITDVDELDADLAANSESRPDDRSGATGKDSRDLRESDAE